MLFFLDHIEFPDLVIILFLDIFIVIETSIVIEKHHVQDTLTFSNNEEILLLPMFFFQK